MVNQKYENLKKYIGQFKRVLVALSGGCDSALLVYAAREALGENALAVTAVSPFFPAEEKERAVQVVKMLDVSHSLIDIGEKQLETVKDNPPDRCYLCKKMIFSSLVELARKEGCEVVFDGSNVDDTSEYRPGLKALAQLGIKSPLREADLTKDEIRELSVRFGLPTAQIPAFSCLATRFPYGSPISTEKLTMLEKAERYLRSKGFTQLRVRLHGNIARIEVPPRDRSKFFNLTKMDDVDAAFKSLGFDYAALDLAGYKSGSMDIHIKK